MSARYVMGSFLRAHAEAGEDSAAARGAMLARVQELEGALSFFLAGSDVSRVNRAAGRAPAAVGPDCLRAVRRALALAERTGGAFDPTYRSEGGGRFRAVILDRPAGTVFLPESGMALDLGGFGKGFALDEALRAARERFDVASAVMDFGGQWLFWARPGTPIHETLAIEDPADPGRVLATLSVDASCSVATSSQGQRPGHLVDPATHRAPADRLSATAVAASGAEAEALSTALFVLGPERAPGLLARFPGSRAVVR